MKRGSFILSAVAASFAASVPEIAKAAVAKPGTVVPHDKIVMARDWSAIAYHFTDGMRCAMLRHPWEWGVDNAMGIRSEMGGSAWRIELHPTIGSAAGSPASTTFWIRQPIDRYATVLRMSWHRIEKDPFREYTDGVVVDMSKLGWRRKDIFEASFQNGLRLYNQYHDVMSALSYTPGRG